MSYTNVKNFRNRLKERAAYVLGSKCQICGYNKTPAALEFHHVDPKKKEMSFSDNANRSWGATREELKKCILLCANCHREAHQGLIDPSLLFPSYSEERAQEIDELVKKVKEGKIWYCQTCGVEIARGAIHCLACANLARRVVERPNREELKNLIRTTSFVQIGKMFGVSDNAVRKWCVGYGLPKKSSEIKSYSNEEWEKI